VSATEESQLASILTGQIVTQAIRIGTAETELTEMGIASPSLADVVAWANASPKQREALAVQWAVMAALGEPEWKGR
jgi:hypothetical protein